jgi:hypothetical protein
MDAAYIQAGHHRMYRVPYMQMESSQTPRHGSRMLHPPLLHPQKKTSPKKVY